MRSPLRCTSVLLDYELFLILFLQVIPAPPIPSCLLAKYSLNQISWCALCFRVKVAVVSPLGGNTRSDVLRCGMALLVAAAFLSC